MTRNKSMFRTITTMSLFVFAMDSIGAMTEIIGDFIWTYSIVNGFAVIERMNNDGGFVETDIVVPSRLGGYQVKALSNLLFFQDPWGSESTISCKTLTLPETIEFIGEIGWGMQKPPLIQKIAVSKSNPWFSSNDGLLYDKTGKKLIYCPYTRSGVLSIPDGVEIIADMALDVTEISLLKIPASVRLIGDSGMGEAFFRPPKLKTIEVDPDNKYYSSYGGALYDKNQTAFLYAPFDLETKWEAEENGETYESSFAIKEGTKYYAGPGIWLCDFDTVFIPDSVIHFGRVIEGGAKTVSIPGRFQSSEEDICIGMKTSIFRSVSSNDPGTKPPNDDIANAQELFGDSGSVIGFTAEGSLEEDEKKLNPTATSSVWYSWTAPKRGTVSVCLYYADLAGQPFSYTNHLMIAKGHSISDLSTIAVTNAFGRQYAWNEFGTPINYDGQFHSSCEFMVMAGETYFFAISDNETMRAQGAPCFRLDWDYVISGQTTTTPEPVSLEWLDQNASAIIAAHGGDYEAAGNAMAANGLNKVWECYVAGTSPTNAAARFEATIEMGADGKPVVRWNPPLAPEEEAKRTRTVLGKRTFDPAEDWTDVTDLADPDAAGYRFFKVKVAMPEK